MKLSDFKAKAVQGLYSFDHFEAPNGAFIQRSISASPYFVYRSSRGSMKEYPNLETLTIAVEKDEG